jgi:hypothetical protein
VGTVLVDANGVLTKEELDSILSDWGDSNVLHSPGAKEEVMLLFVQQNKIHHYPVEKNCSAVYQNEQLRDTIPHDVKLCPYCMNVWPDRKDKTITS